MKQAIIILAHNDINQLIHLVEYFCYDCDVFIHFDRRSTIDEEKMKILKSMSQVKAVYHKFKVYWGGFSILKAQMYMLYQAYKMSDAMTFHVISGHDYPLKPLSFFLEFFEKNKDKDFIRFGRVKPIGTNFESYYRYQFFFPYDYSATRAELFRKMKIWMKLQRILHINRGLPIQFEKLYCGSQWFSITRSSVQTIINYTDKHPAFYRRLKFTFAPEETYFLTIIVNLCDPHKIMNYNLRFIRWHFENGNSPSNLSEEHLHLLVESNDIFARKIVSPYNKTLIPLIDKYLLNDTTPNINSNGTWELNSINGYTYDPGFVNAVYNYCNWKPCYEVLDVGCGCGLYVAAFRRLGIFATGIDANPYTQTLSSLILPRGDKPCQCANIEDVDPKEKFGVVLCVNVLQYISDIDVFKKAITNLIKLARTAIIIDYDDSLQEEKISMTKKKLSQGGFVENDFATGFLIKHSKRINNIHLYEKINKN